MVVKNYPAESKLWNKIVLMASKHNKYVREGRAESKILELYWQTMGMIEAAKILGLYDMPKLRALESRMYKPYE